MINNKNRKKRQVAILLAASMVTNIAALPIQTVSIAASTIQDETQETTLTENVTPFAEGSSEEIAAQTQMETTEPQTPEPVQTQIEATESQTSEPMQTETQTPVENTTSPTEPQTPAQSDTETNTELPTIESTTLPSTEINQETQKQEAFEQAIQSYQSMPISSDRSMPLEWWYMMAGKLTVSDFVMDENGSGHLNFPNSIIVGSASELILLSYVNPATYEDKTIKLMATAGNEFDLTGSVTANGLLTYQGLGSFDHPFRGTISYADQSEGIFFTLNTSLFDGLTSDAKFLNANGQKNEILLVSKATATFDGLLAKHVIAKSENRADWSVRISDSQDATNTYQLPSLFGILYSGVKISLTVTDNSSAEPSARGYLCASMQAGSELNGNSNRKITVPMVGELSDQAVLNVQNLAEEAEFDELVEYYRTMPVIPGEMPLEWWFVVSDKLDELKEYLEWKAEKSGEGSVQKDIALFADAENTGTETFALNDIKSADDLIKLSITNASEYKNTIITITSTGASYDLTGTVTTENGTTITFQGLGSDQNPFSGTFQFSEASENTYFTLNHSLFNAISADATVSKVNLSCKAKSGDLTGLFAKSITAGSKENLLTVQINLKSADNVQQTEKEDLRLPALVHTIEASAKVKLTATINSNDIPQIDANGFFCDEIKENAELTVNYPSSMPTFGTSKEMVGGLVGSMVAGASLKVEAGSTGTGTSASKNGIVIDVTTAGKNAGGLVGSMADGATLSIDAASLTVQKVQASEENGSYVGGLVATAVNPVFEFKTITQIEAGTVANEDYHLTGYFVGGMVGQLQCTNDEYKVKVLPVSGLKLRGNDCGGLFSELDNGCSTLTIPSIAPSGTNSITYLVDDVTVTCNATILGTQSAGGLIGWYNPKKDHCKLIADGISVKMSSDGFAYVGGMIGSSTGTNGVNGHHDIDLTDSNVEIKSSKDSQNLGGLVGSLRVKTVYLKASGTVTNQNHTGSTTFGGLVAYADEYGDLIEVGKVNLENFYINNESGNAGGLVGKMDSGILYMTEKPELNFDNMVTNSSDTRGWILGNRGNVLVCTTAKEWLTRTDDKDTNDTGVWGQVLQLSKFDQDLVKLDEKNHTVMIRKLPENCTEDNYTDYYKISSLTDFAAVALRMQLNAIGLLKFEGNDIDASADIKLKIEENINLENTGLTGLTRDAATKYGDTTERHAITMEGATENTTITLPNTIVYPVGSSGKSHSHQGLIAEVKNLTIKNLTFEGSPQVKSLDNETRCGIANDIYGDATIDTVTSSIKWTDIAENNSSTISGVLTRLIDNDNSNNRSKNVKIKDCKWDGSIITKLDKQDGRSSSGFIGYGYAKSVTFENCTISGTITKETNDTANVGGLFATINGANELEIRGLTVRNTIDVKNVAEATGGLLGYQWNCNATIAGVKIEGATLQAPKARFGGLVYAGRGYWQVQKNGITFKKQGEIQNTFKGRSDQGNASGLLVADGFWEKNGLYLEVLYDGYQIEANSVSVMNSSGNSFTYFDELVGKSKNNTSDGNYSGIVSIATSDSESVDERKIDQRECNTYQDQTTAKTYKNPDTRYYYNLDLFRKNMKAEGNINTSAKMVLWSAYNSCAINLQSYFLAWGTKTITGDLDLTGYSFYPVPFDWASISNAQITFDFQTLEDKENTRKPSNNEYQHAEMHTGIFTSAINNAQDTKNMIVSVQALTLSGVVGGYQGSYGAIVRGNVQGKDAEHITTLNIFTVTLNGIRMYGADKTNSSNSYDVAPLLIHSIGSYTTMNLNNVTTATGRYQSGSGTSATTVKAASSLIGNVGSENAAEIKLNFSNMQLAESGDKNDKCTIFTHALFLESFKYQGGTCQGTYNFRSSDNYTLGQELSNTTSGRNKEKQYWFFGEEGEENEIYKKLNLQGNASNAFLPYPRYVCQVENDKETHEIDINLPAVNLLEGCGTYSHPYIINNPGQLTALNNAIKGDPNADWQIAVTQAVLTSGSFGAQDGHTTDSTTNSDVIYKYDSSKGKWINNSDTKDVQEKVDVQEYLRNAYYKITEDLTLKSWSGLGASTEKQRFQGVIVGDKADRKITIEAGSGAQFGGLIAFSSGSVVKDLTIAYEGTVTISLTKNTSNEDVTPNSTASASFFGGVVGWCLGGDTIIDNVKVQYNSATIKADSIFTCVGGYVGLVGGASDQGGGGVVFRGTLNSTLNANSNGQYYKNPYVGRVLDGYAVSETQKIDNGADNYPIPYLTNVSNGTDTPNLTIDSDNATIDIGNAEGLWLLSAMENSRHGDAYSKGKPRSGDYSKIGQKVGKDELIDEQKSGSYTEEQFYLWKHFGVNSAIPTNALTLNINADCDMRSFGNAFRGIGVSQGNLITATGTGTGGTGTGTSGYNPTSAFLKITKVSGGENGHTITLAQDRKEYNDESLYWASMGTGLFPILVCQAGSGQQAGTTIENLTIAGTTKLSAGYTFTKDDKLFDTQPIRVGAGMLAGAVLNNNKNSSIKIEAVTVSGSVEANVVFAGGLIGYCGATISNWSRLESITIEDCKVIGKENSSTVVGKTNIGGLIGYTYAKEVTVDNFTGSNLTLNVKDSYLNIKNATTAASSYSNGIGGLFGLVYNGELEVDTATISGLTIQNKSQPDLKTDIGFGGLVGAINTSEKSNGSIKGIKFEGITVIEDENTHVSTGGLIGYLADMSPTGWEIGDTKASSFAISDVELGSSEDSSVTLKGFQAGGLIGMVKDGSVTMTIGGKTTDENGKEVISPVKIGHYDNSKGNVTISKNSYSSGHCISGLIGITCNNPSITIQNLYLNGITVGEAKYTSLILARNAKANSTLNLKNVEILNSSVRATENGQSGFLYGSSDGNNNQLPVNGYNILLRSCSIDDNAGALLGGNNTNSEVKLVAVSVIDCSGKETDFVSTESSYVIRANYKGTEKNTTGSDAPYVPVNPYGSGSLKSPISELTITGDGAAFVEGTTTSKTAVGSQIITDANSSTIAKSKTYYTVSDAIKFYNTNDPSKPRISTYNTAGSNISTDQSGSDSGTTTAQPEDFPVLVIPAVSKSEVNNAVYQYISLLTNYVSNTTTLKDKLQTGGITASTYVWKNGVFQKASGTTTCSLTVANDGTISATTGCYDNTKNQFTLLDIPFIDPTDLKNTYHLYIPVIVQKLMNYRFSAAASVGTSYYTSHYEKLNTQVLASHEEQVTTLLTFEYERSRADWQTAIDNGENLLWDFDKVIWIDSESTDKLPNGTKLTLVDKNNQNKAYFASYDGNSEKLNFNTFSGYTDNRTYLCDGLSLSAEKATIAAADGKVQYVKLGESTGATLRIKDASTGEYAYYRPFNATDKGDKYTITVNGDENDDYLLKEQYYLTLQTPKKSTAFVNILIKCESSLSNSLSNDMLPNKLVQQKNENWYTCNSNENRIVIGDFFNEKVTLDSNSDELISEENNSIQLNVESKISFVDNEWFKHYQTYATGTSLHQRFDLQLKQWNTDSDGTSTNFTAGTVMKVEYFKDGERVDGGRTETLPETAVVALEFPQEITFTTGSTSEAVPSVTLKAEVTLTYSAGCILNQFIKRSTSEAREGLQFLAFSHLAYSEDALKRSSVSSSYLTNGKRFYREEQNVAILLYNSDGGTEHDRMDQLGVNGRLSEEASISSYATYDVSKLGTVAASATTLSYSFQLLKKNNNGEYVAVENSSLYSIGTMSVKWLSQSGEVETSTSTPNNASGTVSLNSKLDPSAAIEFSIPLTINSGSTLENANQTYSNYQVRLTVSLSNKDTAINGSTTSDYIIYTNAKIVTDLIE